MAATALAGKNGSFWSATTGAALLSNLDFNTGASKWTSGAAKTSGAYEGTGCAVLDDVETMYQTGPATLNKYYAISCMAKIGATTTPTGVCYLKLAFTSGGTGTIVTSGTDTIGTGATSWTRYSVIRRATDANTDGFMAQFIAGTGTTLYVDDVRCTKMEQVGGFSNWSMDINYDTHDTTCFESPNDWREYISGLKGWTASATRFWDSAEMFYLLSGGTAIHSVFYIDQSAPTVMTGSRFEGLAHIGGISITTPVDAVITSDITFQGTEDIAYIDD